MTGIFSFLLSAGPMVYYTRQNYKVFATLSYQVAPDLLNHLEREIIWMDVFLFSSLVAIVAFCIVLGLRVGARWIAPVKILKTHLKHLSRGEWFVPPLHTRDTDEFQDLVESYNYFYNSLRLQIQRDLVTLAKMNIDPKNYDANFLWQALVEEKQNQIKVKINLELESPLKSA